MLRRPFSNSLWKPKNPHSLDYLKYLYQVLCKNQTVTESNCNLLIESLRMISEILIWGDQNDSAVIDFFLEKSMLSFFLRYMKQKTSSYICVQLLQTLNILFENISDKTSIYYLLSNNHINSIICHKFDFSDDEIMAYYISFLKTLSFKLNKHTIHFFYNELTNDFALYTEAIKFFNHSENMVRIAVRTITLNVYKAEDKAMLRYIRDKTAVPYFSNLVWFIGNHVLELDACVRNDAEHNSRGRLEDLVAEHLDHLHYLNDILSLRIGSLNDVLCDHLMNRLFLPLLVCSLPRLFYEKHTVLVQSICASESEEPFLSGGVALFLLTQVFLIIHHPALVQALSHIIFHGHPVSSIANDGDGRSSGDTSTQDKVANSVENATDNGSQNLQEATDTSSLLSTDISKEKAMYLVGHSKQWAFVAPDDNIAKMLESRRDKPRLGVFIDEDGSINRTKLSLSNENISQPPVITKVNSAAYFESLPATAVISNSTKSDMSSGTNAGNCTDEEKIARLVTNQLATNASAIVLAPNQRVNTERSNNRAFLDAILHALGHQDGDYESLFAICLFYAIYTNKGMNSTALGQLFYSAAPGEELNQTKYDVVLMEALLALVTRACKSDSCVRVVTLEMAVTLIKLLVMCNTQVATNENGCETNSGYESDAQTMTLTNGTLNLQDRHFALLEEAKEEALLTLRSHYKNDEIFLDQFEDEYYTMNNSRTLNVEYLMMDASLLLQPTGTPLSGIEFTRRHPCGDTEKMRRAIRVFLLLRALSHRLRGEEDSELPLDKCMRNVELEDKLDLRNSDLIACTITKDGKKERRFLVVEYEQMILVEPDNKRLGWGVVTFVGHLQHVELNPDPDDTRTLHMTVRRAPTSMGVTSTTSPFRSVGNATSRGNLLSSVPFVFDDHIRCNAAKQRLTRGREKVLQQKMAKIARLLDLPATICSLMPTTIGNSRFYPTSNHSCFPYAQSLYSDNQQQHPQVFSNQVFPSLNMSLPPSSLQSAYYLNHPYSSAPSFQNRKDSGRSFEQISTKEIGDKTEEPTGKNESIELLETIVKDSLATKRKDSNTSSEVPSTKKETSDYECSVSNIS